MTLCPQFAQTMICPQFTFLYQCFMNITIQRGGEGWVEPSAVAENGSRKCMFSLSNLLSYFFLSDHFSSHIFSLSDLLSYFLLQFQSLSHIFYLSHFHVYFPTNIFQTWSKHKTLSNFQPTYQDIRTTLILQNINCHSSRYDAHPLPAPPLNTKVN